MGLYVIPYAVDVSSVRASIGSRDPALLDKLISSDLFQVYAEGNDFGTSEGYDLGKALQQLISGTILHSQSQVVRPWWQRIFSPTTVVASGIESEMFGYALLVICDHVGTHLLSEDDGFYLGRNFEEASSILHRAGLKFEIAKMIEGSDVFSLPVVFESPAIGYFTKSQIAEVNAVFENIHLDPLEADKGHPHFKVTTGMLWDLKHCFRQCAELDRELVTFTH